MGGSVEPEESARQLKPNQQTIPSSSTTPDKEIFPNKVLISQKPLNNQTEGYQDEIIVFNEQLFRVQGDDLQEVLHRSIGCLTFLNKYKKMSAGSGVLIAPNSILTAAHNIYDKQNQCEYTDFQFYLGVDGVAQEYHQIEGWRFPEEFKTCPQSDKLPFDYAIMKLKKPISFDQYLLLSMPCEICLSKEEKELKVFGFPKGYSNFIPLSANGKKMKLFQYGIARKKRVVVIYPQNFKIGYGISTLGGQSGCPVAVDNSVIAIHVGGDKGQFNVGRIIDPTLIRNAWNWIADLNNRWDYQDHFQLGNYPCLHGNQQTIYLNLQQKMLATLDLFEYSNLMMLYLSNNKLQSIDLSRCPNLAKLDLSANQLPSISLTDNKHIMELNLCYNKLETVDIRLNIDLKYLRLENNQLQKVDVSLNVHLMTLNLSSNKLSNIDVRSNIYLTSLSVSQNQLKEIDVSSNVRLAYLNISINKIQNIDMKTNINLTCIYLSSNKLQKLDVRSNAYLKQLRMSSNKVQNMDVSSNINLTFLDISQNELQTINLNSNLTNLYLSSNKLQYIDVSSNTKLIYLFLDNNKLQKIDVSSNTHLMMLGLSKNKLSDIDVTNNFNVEWLILHSNKIKEIDLRKNAKLTKIKLQDNKLASIYLNILGNTSVYIYTEAQAGDFYFDLAHQKSAACRVQLICEGEAAREKAVNIASKLQKRYSGQWSNKYKCLYSFQVK